MATSGINVRVWRRADGRYAHHLIDPRTGEPAWTGLVGVTALAPTGVEAETLAKAALRDDLASMQRQLTAVALRAAPNERDPARLAALWEAAHKNVLERFSQVLADLRTAEAPDLAMLSVAMRELRNLAARS